MAMKKVLLTSFLIYSLWSAFVVALLALTPATLFYITPTFSGIDMNHLIEAFLLILLLSVLNPVKLDNPFYLFFIGANFFILIPLVTFRFCTSKFSTEIIDQTLSIILLGFFLSRTVALLPFRVKSDITSLKNEVIEQQIRILSNVLAILSVIIIAFTAFRFGLQALNLDYSSIYTQRLTLRRVVPEGSFLGYALNNVEQLFLPCLFLFGLYLRKRKYVLISTSATLVYFSFSGSRSAIVMLILLIFLFKLHDNRFNIKIIQSTLLLTFSIFFLLVYYFRNTAGGNSMYEFLLRTVVSPGTGSIRYVEYFNSFDTTNFQQSRIVAFLFGIEPIQVTYTLGKLFYDNSQQNLSSNIWCDALISGGILGVILVSISLGLVLLFLRLLLTNQSSVWVYPLYGYVTLNFIEQSFLTSFLSGGFMLSFILAYYLHRKNIRTHVST